jgi:hypothetical protein
MAETTPPSPAPAATPAATPATPEPAPSGLEKVYSDFGIEEQAATFQPQSPAPAQPAAPAQTPTTPAFKAPDPFSPEFAAYQAQLASGVSSLHQSLQQTRQQLTQLDQQLHKRQVEADIKSAAKTLAEKANIDPDIAEVAFEAQARKDPRLLQVWNNRGKNPKALEAAINALGTEFAQKYAVRQDPQLVENQRAVAASRNSMATTQKTTEQDKWADMTPQEREVERQRILRMR